MLEPMQVRILIILDEIISFHRLKSCFFYLQNSIELVESIPEGLIYPDGSPVFQSTYEAWIRLIELSNKTIDIGSFYWTLRGDETFNHSSAWQGESIYQNLLLAGTKSGVKIRIAQNKPSDVSDNSETEMLAKQKAAEVRSLDFSRLIGGGVLHTKLWIVDGKHVYIGSANMDWRALTQVSFTKNFAFLYEKMC